MLDSRFDRRRQSCSLFFLLSGMLSLAACGGSSQPSVTVPPPQETVSITAIPCLSAPCSIGAGANWQYAASVTGSTKQSVTWSISPTTAGSIDASSGFYIAPNTVPSSPTVTVTATTADGSASVSTTLTIQANDPLGSVTYSVLPSCTGSIQNAACYQLTVSCPGVADLFAYLKVNNPTGTPIGTVLFGTGTGGTGLYDDPTAGGYEYGSEVITDVAGAGFNTVQVSFGGPFNPSPAQPNGWLQGPGGVRRLACRYATIADWVYHNPSIINPGVSASASNSAPMCATGNSGGSAAVVYAAYEYGLGTNLNEFAMIEPTSGPVMTRIDRGCSPASASGTGAICAGSSNVASMTYETADASVIDEAYQASGASAPTPCTSAINGSTPPAGLFLSDSILYDTSSLPIAFPKMTVKLLYGDLDTSNAVPEGMTWGESITPSSSSPSPFFQCLPGVQHDIPSSPVGTASGDQPIASDIISLCH